MMHTGYIKCLAVVALTAILIASFIWSAGIYRSSYANYQQTIELCLHRTADLELYLRLFSDGHPFLLRHHPEKDTATYGNLTITTADTVINLWVNKKDPALHQKTSQYICKGFLPLNPNTVDSLFRRCMAEHHVEVPDCYIDYLDLEKDTLIGSSNRKAIPSDYQVISGIDTLDILKTIGIRAYVKVPPQVIFRPVIYKFVLPIILIMVALAGIVLLVKNILRLRKKGFRILHTVSQRAEQAMTEAAGQIRETSDRLRIKQAEEEASALDQTRGGLLINTGYFERLRLIVENEEGNITFNKTTFGLQLFFDELKEHYEDLIYKTTIIQIHVDGGPIFIHTDQYYFKRIFEELLDNCVKHSGDPVAITIMATQTGDKINIAVCDTGGGIIQSNLDDLFIVQSDLAKFYKEMDVEYVPSKPKPGLGLSFARSFTRSLGGKMKVTTEDGMTGIILEFYQTKEDLEKTKQASCRFQHLKESVNEKNNDDQV